jgi:hypothetical protein
MVPKRLFAHVNGSPSLRSLSLRISGRRPAAVGGHFLETQQLNLAVILERPLVILS